MILTNTRRFGLEIFFTESLHVGHVEMIGKINFTFSSNLWIQVCCCLALLCDQLQWFGLFCFCRKATEDKW